MSSFLSRLTVERVARCPFTAAHEYVADFLREAQRQVDVRVPLRDVVPLLGGSIAKPVELVFALQPDEHEGGRGHDAMQIAWRAQGRLFPDFHGALRLRIASVETTLLTLEGAYQPPFGPAGRVVDALVGRRIARATMGELLGRIAAELEAREERFRGDDPR